MINEVIMSISIGSLRSPLNSLFSKDASWTHEVSIITASFVATKFQSFTIQPHKRYFNCWTKTTQKDCQGLCVATNNERNNNDNNSGSNHSTKNEVRFNKDNKWKNSKRKQNKHATTMWTQQRVAGTQNKMGKQKSFSFAH